MKNYFEASQSLDEANEFIQFILCRALSHPVALKTLFLDDDYVHVFSEIGLEAIYVEFHAEVEKQAHLKFGEDENSSLSFISHSGKKELAEAIFAQKYKPLVEEQLSTFLDANNQIPKDSSLAGRNAYALQALLGLTDIETTIFLIYVHYDEHPTLEKVISKCPTPVTPQKRIFYLSVLTGIEQQNIKDVLDQGNSLFSLGLLGVNSSIRGIHTEEHIPKFNVPSAIKYRIHKPHENVLNIIDYTYAEPPKTECTIEDFSFVKNQQLLVNAIKKAAKNDERGFNILIHGDPGKGKTTFAQTLFEAAGVTAKMVAWEDDDKRSLDGEKRLQFFNMIQHTLKARGRWGLIFDEASDTLATVPSLFNKPPSVSKNHINASLENNALPVIYICNDISYFDQATLDRFLFKLEMPAMTEAHRLETLRKSVECKLGISVKTEWIEKHAQNSHLTPRHIDNAFRMANLAFEKEQNSSSLDQVDQIIDNYQSYLPKVPSEYALAKDYDVQYVNCDTDPGILIERFSRVKSVRAMFYGLSGTGKSAFARYLLTSAGIKFKAYSVSDLVSKYVGETEKLIAKMFRDATKNREAIVIDEFDSFVTDRGVAQHQWERTMVNQFLEELEKFQGIFIATTNYEKLLDTAILRRFSIRLEFYALRKEQAYQLFTATIKRLELTPDTFDVEVRDDIASLQSLTPGDFNAINTRLDWLGIRTASGYLQELKSEVAHKQTQTRSKYGFVGSLKQ